MRVGRCRLQLHIPDSNSLKDKRRVLDSLTDRLRQKYNISVAEVGDNDVWRTATLGVACLANDRRFVEAVLNKVVNFVETQPQVTLLDWEMEVD